ncbi:hypothetical protein HK101_000889 [Irineochytrium annulatum]|nr:hypothetical protein HK101_000889 [Irineochytrium annulatum]
MGRLEGKVALITGGGSGIGFESCVLFAKEGCKVVCCDINKAAADATVERIAADYGKGKAISVKVDVSKEAEVKAAVELTEKTFGKLNIIFNNAGIMHSDDDNALTTEEKVWDLTMNINVKDTTSKGAVLAMTRELAVIHARENIRVNALCPGPLRTNLLMDFLNTEEKKERRLVHNPMGRFGEAIEQAYAALFLASDESSFVTGTDFLVDGGLTAAYVTPLGPTTSASPFKNFSGV